MYNLLYYSKNFRKTTGSFRNYYPDKPISGYIGDKERTRIFNPIKESENFDYKTKFVGTLPAGNNPELPNIKIILSLKNLSNFIFNLNFLMINTEIELILKWSKNCVLTEKMTRTRLEAKGNNPAVNPINRPATLNFSIPDCKLYVPVVTLQEKYDNEMLKA